MSARDRVAAELARHQGLRGPMDEQRPDVWQNRCECGWDDGDEHPGWRYRYRLHVADAVLALARDLERCRHGRCRIDACLGCGRRYSDGVLAGPFMPAEGPS